MSSLKNTTVQQPLLESKQHHTMNKSPLISYASEPEADRHGNFAIHSSLKSRLHHKGQMHNYCKNCNCDKCQNRVKRYKRLHRRNKKNLNKKKKDDNIPPVEPSKSVNILIKQLIKQSNNCEKQIHCMSVCKSYDFHALSMDKQFDGYRIFACHEDALHFKLIHQRICNQNNDDIQCIMDDIDVFVFQNEGVIIFWNVNKTNRYRFISFLKRFEINYEENEVSETILPQTDDFDYGLCEEFEIDNMFIGLSIKNCFDPNYIESCQDYFDSIASENDGDHIHVSVESESSSDQTLEQKVEHEVDKSDQFLIESVNWKAVRGVLMMQKLAISHGLAQSVKLTVFELRTDDNIQLNEDIPRQMAVNGSIKLNQKQIVQRMGRLFVLRSELNLHCVLLDTPEVFYENDLFEKEYLSVREYLDIDKRIEIINTRFELLHELFEIVMGQQEAAHGSKLEWIIIWLIVIEVVLGVIELAIDKGAFVW